MLEKFTSWTHEHPKKTKKLCFASFWQFLDPKNHGTFCFWMIFHCLWYAAMQIQHFRSELPVPTCNLCKASKACTMQRPPTHVICRLTDRIEIENVETKHAKHGKNTASNIESCTSMLLPDSILTCFFVAIWFRFGLVKKYHVTKANQGKCSSYHCTSILYCRLLIIVV